MTDRIFVIDIDLDDKVEKIISNEIHDLSLESKDKLNSAIAMAESLQKLKNDKEKTKTEKEEFVKSITEELINAGATGMPCQTIYDKAKTVDITSSVISTKIKLSLIENHEDKYELCKETINKEKIFVIKSK